MVKRRQNRYQVQFDLLVELLIALAFDADAHVPLDNNVLSSLLRIVDNISESLTNQENLDLVLRGKKYLV